MRLRRDIRNKLLMIACVITTAILFTFPFEKHINLGLDLKGGMHLIVRVDTSGIKEELHDDAVLRAIEILRNRIDSIGVGETVIQRQGDSQILVQLPGVTDRNKALAMIGDVALLEFRLVNADPVKLKEALAGNVPRGFILREVKGTGEERGEQVLLEEKVAMKGEYISDARVDFDQYGSPKISIGLNTKGTRIFGKLTKNHVNEQLAIVVDDVILSAPNINEPIMSGRGEISGNFTYDEASQLALQLRSGALPAPMKIEEERTIGPLLGKDSIDAGISATLIGGGLVFIFMILYYFSSGFISDIALTVNILLIIGSMGFLNAMLPDSPVTLTLPGIAGIILTLGMAVDANVLINERIREEIDAGRPALSAVNNGFNKAFKAIFDSNSTTLIAAFMLFQFGSGPIKGFAVTLSIGLLSTLFTALFVTKTLFNLFTDLGVIKKLRMLRIFKDPNFNFTSKRYICFVISAFLVVGSIGALILKKDKAYGIDFAGGQIQEFRFEEPMSPDRMRGVLAQINLEDAVIQTFDKYPNNILIRTAKTSEEAQIDIPNTLREELPNEPFEVLRIEQVGPVVGKALRMRALLAIVLALGGILIYVGFRFNHFDFAAAGVVALLHDVTITLGILVMVNRQIDLLVVTALLTIAGYSINDTIIIYDRVRENLIGQRKAALSDIINLSVNQTLGRTILTTITTLLVVLSLYFFGGEVLNTFALCLIIGFIAGTYSTIFIASPLVLAMQKKK